MTNKKTVNPLVPPAHVEGLIFDLDGTLADTMPIHLEAWIEAGNYHNVMITERMIIERAGSPTVQVIRQLSDLYGWGIDPIKFRLVKNEIYSSIKKSQGKIQPIADVLRIAELYKEELPMAVGTGSISKNAILALNDLGIKDWFKGMITADDVIAHKPHPETFLKCADLIGIVPHKCFVYEDGAMGIDAALSAGMSAVNIQTLEIFHP